MTPDQIETMRKIQRADRLVTSADAEAVLALPVWSYRTTDCTFIGAPVLTEAGAEVLRLWDALDAEKASGVQIGLSYEEELQASRAAHAVTMAKMEEARNERDQLRELLAGLFTTALPLVADSVVIGGPTVSAEMVAGCVRGALETLDGERRVLRAALEETRLVLTAEQGRPEGAPSEGWQPLEGILDRWRKNAGRDNYGNTIWLFAERQNGITQRWCAMEARGRGGEPPRGGRPLSWHSTARAAMLAADKATS